MLVTTVQSEQTRILQAHGHLTTPRLVHFLDHQADAVQWVAENWQASHTPRDDIEVRHMAAEALAIVMGTAL